jgi:hypothetical protein
VNRLPLALVALAAVLLAPAAESRDKPRTPRSPLVTVVRHGGLCLQGADCRTTFRIADTRVTGEGYLARPLRDGERRALVRAIAKLDRRTLQRFRGTCPIAFDGQESIYRFRGFAVELPSCTYDLQAVEAVRVTERIIGSLRPRG